MTDFEIKIKQLKEILDNSHRIVLFTGAGISCGSGIPDFRSANGLYNTKTGTGASPEEIISHSFFVSNTKDFYDFYLQNMVYEKAEPNLAHAFFAELERLGKLTAVVTQNIDGLHQKAGSKNVYELHGSVFRNSCVKCGRFHTLKEVLLSVKSGNGVPKCKVCGGTIKPDVVLYEEQLDDDTVNGALNAISTADTLIIVGTSLAVYPAAGFVRYFNGKSLILINKTPTPYDKNADLVINEDIVFTIEKLSRLM